MLAVISVRNSARAEARIDSRTAAQHHAAPGEQVNALPGMGSPPIEQQRQLEDLRALSVANETASGCEACTIDFATITRTHLTPQRSFRTSPATSPSPARVSPHLDMFGRRISQDTQMNRRIPRTSSGAFLFRATGKRVSHWRIFVHELGLPADHPCVYNART